MLCGDIYAVLINNMIIAADIHAAFFSVAAYTVILCDSLSGWQALQNPSSVRTKEGSSMKQYNIIHADPSWSYRTDTKKGQELMSSLPIGLNQIEIEPDCLF